MFLNTVQVVVYPKSPTRSGPAKSEVRSMYRLLIVCPLPSKVAPNLSSLIPMGSHPLPLVHLELTFPDA